MKFKQIIKEILNPRFSVEELENSHTECGWEFKITTMFFDDNKRHFPTQALGWIAPVQGNKIIATWNLRGECFVNGSRIKSFNLIKSTLKEIDAILPVLLGLIFISLLLIL